MSLFYKNKSRNQATSVCSNGYSKGQYRYRRILAYILLFAFLYQQIGVLTVAAGSVRVSQ